MIGELTLQQGTEWPAESRAAAQGLLDTINACPDVPKNISSGMGKLADAVENTHRVLGGVHTKLKKAAEKYGIKERGLRDELKYRASSFRKSKCPDTLQACLEEVRAALTTLRVSLDEEVAKDAADEGSEAAPEIQSVPQMSSPASSQMTPAAQTTVPSLQTLDDQGEPNLIRGNALNVARKTFKTVEIASGIIPVVGNYVGAAAK
ncbi:hypothetical protein FRC00_012963, partial [Tulasnella sp. 408]